MDQRTFIRKLERENELLRISAPADPFLEITEIADRFSKQPEGGKALLFEDTGTGIPLLINSLGSKKRITTAFGGRSPVTLAGEIHQLILSFTGQEPGWTAKLKKIPLLGKAARWMPRRKRGRGKCQAVINRNPDLRILPILTCWPHDGGPFITLPLVHTQDPVSGNPNLGMYRMQVLDPQSTGMHWHIHKTGARHYREYQRLGKKMPVAVALGGDPVYTYCATAPLPDGIDEYLLAGFIRKRPVGLVKCITQDLWVPEDADIILEGYVDPAEPLVMEGPFGDHTGFYSLEDLYPKFHLTAITHRKNPVYPATIVGIPPQEDAWIAWATERLFEPLIRFSMLPELVGFHIPVAGVAHNIVLASIRADYPGHGRKVLHTLWGAGQMMFTKFTVIAGEDAPLTNYFDLARHVSARVDPARNTERAAGPLDILDHSCRKPAFGGKLGLDATGPALFGNSAEESSGGLEALAAFRSHHPEITAMNLGLLKKGISAGLVAIRKSRKGAVRDLIDDIRLNDAFGLVRFWFVFDEWANLDSPDLLAWLVGSNTDAECDILILGPSTGRSHGVMYVDATIKTREFDDFDRPWPNPVTMDLSTIQKVDARWQEYGIGRLIHSPSLAYLGIRRPGGAAITQ
ncbi:MAG: menaquinone biosynthesis decarboxylase [Bacteroidales bacterium]